MTSPNGNNFRVTGLSCGEFTVHGWIPLTRVSDAELWCLIWPAPEQTIEQTIETQVIWDSITLIMTSLWFHYRKAIIGREPIMRKGFPCHDVLEEMAWKEINFRRKQIVIYSGQYMSICLSIHLFLYHLSIKIDIYSLRILPRFFLPNYSREFQFVSGNEANYLIQINRFKVLFTTWSLTCILESPMFCVWVRNVILLSLH